MGGGRAWIARALVAVGVLAIAIAGALLVLHERSRDAWSIERARMLDGTGYDAARSDALWDETRALRASASRATWAAVIALLLAAPIVAPRPRHADAIDAAPVRVAIATALDGAIAIGIAFGAWSARELVASPAIADVVEIALPGLFAAAWLASLTRGASPGLRACRLRARDAEGGAPGARAIVAALFLPLAAAWSPIALACALGGARRIGLVAPHLAAAGITARTRASA